MNAPLVSICIPAYNAEKYIAEAMDSVLAQTYPHVEIIVVNDGSTDNTAKVLEAYEVKGVKVYHCQNKGAAAARNFAYEQSSGAYIKFFDADDLISHDMIEKQVAVLNGKENYIASSEWGRFYQDNVSNFTLNPEKVWRDMPALDWLVESLWEGPNMMQPGIFLVPRGIIGKAGLWDDRLKYAPNDDFEFMVRALLNSEYIKFIPGARLYYRSAIAQGSLSQQKTRKAMESAWLSIELGCRHMLERENSERVRKVCADTYQLWAYNFYPDFPDLVANAEQRVKELGGSDYAMPAGKVLRALDILFGWKKAKSIQKFAYNLGYSPI